MDRSFDPALQRTFSAVVQSAKRSSITEQLGEVLSICSQHGSYQSAGTRYFGKREVWTPCADCHESRLAAERQREAQDRARANLAQLEIMLKETAVPARFVGRTLDNFAATTDAQLAALAVMRDFAEHFEMRAKRGDCLVLSGAPGTGKSHLATAVLQAILPAHCGLYTTCLNVVRAVRGTWRKDSEQSETQVLSMFGSVPLLVIDEVGVQYGTDGEQTILFDVVDRRYRDMRPTIFLTNQDRGGFKSFLGERAFDRLTETARWIVLDWPSYRPIARKESVA